MSKSKPDFAKFSTTGISKSQLRIVRDGVAVIVAGVIENIQIKKNVKLKTKRRKKPINLTMLLKNATGAIDVSLDVAKGSGYKNKFKEKAKIIARGYFRRDYNVEKNEIEYLLNAIEAIPLSEVIKDNQKYLDFLKYTEEINEENDESEMEERKDDLEEEEEEEEEEFIDPRGEAYEFLKENCYKIGAKIDECDIEKDQDKISELVEELRVEVQSLNGQIDYCPDYDPEGALDWNDGEYYDSDWFCSIEIENHEEGKPYEISSSYVECDDEDIAEEEEESEE